jgi:hypothetical protein
MNINDLNNQKQNDIVTSATLNRRKPEQSPSSPARRYAAVAARITANISSDDLHNLKKIPSIAVTKNERVLLLEAFGTESSFSIKA